MKDLTPEDRYRIYEEVKCRLDHEKNSIRHIIRYWIYTILIVSVVSYFVHAISTKEDRDHYMNLDKSFLETLKQVNLLNIAAVYYNYLIDRPPCAGFRDRLTPSCFWELETTWRTNPWRQHRYLVIVPLEGLVFTAVTVSTANWLSVVLIGIAVALGFAFTTRLLVRERVALSALVMDFGALAVTQLYAAAATFAFLAILYPFAWVMGHTFEGLLHLVIVVASIPFIGDLLIRLSEHQFSVKAIKTLAHEPG